MKTALQIALAQREKLERANTFRAVFKVRDVLHVLFLDAPTKWDARKYIEEQHPFDHKTWAPNNPKTWEFPVFLSLRKATYKELNTLEP